MTATIIRFPKVVHSQTHLRKEPIVLNNGMRPCIEVVSDYDKDDGVEYLLIELVIRASNKQRVIAALTPHLL